MIFFSLPVLSRMKIDRPSSSISLPPAPCPSKETYGLTTLSHFLDEKRILHYSERLREKIVGRSKASCIEGTWGGVVFGAVIILKPQGTRVCMYPLSSPVWKWWAITKLF